jgi:hypothetical protein
VPSPGGRDQNHFTAATVGANVSTTAGAGVGTSTSPAVTVTVTPSGILNGTTRYDYKVVLRDHNGAPSAPRLRARRLLVRPPLAAIIKMVVLTG